MLRAQLQEIARQVEEIEERLKNEDFLHEIRSDLLRHVLKIKKVLGEDIIDLNEKEKDSAFTNNKLIKKTNEIKKKNRFNKKNNSQTFLNDNNAKIDSTKSINNVKRWKTLSMTNKTPFWNEHSQVYQVKIVYFLNIK